VRSDRALANGAWLASNFFVVVDLRVNEEHPVVQMLVAGCYGREWRHGFLRRPVQVERQDIRLAVAIKG
jgi:hypothetical protein